MSSGDEGDGGDYSLGEPEQEPDQPRKKGGVPGAKLAAAIVSVVGLFVAIIVIRALSDSSRQQEEKRVIKVVSTSVDAGTGSTLKGAIQAVSPAVVYITSKVPGDSETRQGTGFLISPRGYILTNAHVVHAGNADVSVFLSDKNRVAARVLGLDVVRDLGVLKIGGDGYPWAELGDSDGVAVGDEILVMGYPMGSILGDELSVSAGIVSSVRRREGFIQVDAPVNPGNSGGPTILRSSRKVIGITTSKMMTAEGVAFAIPIKKAIAFFRQTVPGEDLGSLPAPPPPAAPDARSYEPETTPVPDESSRPSPAPAPAPAPSQPEESVTPSPPSGGEEVQPAPAAPEPLPPHIQDAPVDYVVEAQYVTRGEAMTGKRPDFDEHPYEAHGRGIIVNFAKSDRMFGMDVKVEKDGSLVRKYMTPVIQMPGNEEPMAFSVECLNGSGLYNVRVRRPLATAPAVEYQINVRIEPVE